MTTAKMTAPTIGDDETIDDKNHLLTTSRKPTGTSSEMEVDKKSSLKHSEP
jgi:hypothetical protein